MQTIEDEIFKDHLSNEMVLVLANQTVIFKQIDNLLINVFAAVKMEKYE